MIEWLRHRFHVRSAAFRAERIGLTNCVIAALRNRLVNPFEVYVKSWYGGAYNGCAWTTASGNADVYFSEVRPRRGTPAREKAKRFHTDWITTSVAFSSPETLEDFLERVEKEFREELAADPALDQRVARLQVWYWFRADSKEEGRAIVGELAEGLGLVLPGEYAMAEPWALPGTEPLMNADIEMTLQTPADERVMIDALQSLMPGLSGTIFGKGATWRGSTADRGALVTGRQF